MKHLIRGQRETSSITLAVMLLSACATAAPLQTEGSTSQIRAAEELGAADVPQAKLQLQLAREGLAQAEALASEGKGERAQSMLARAEADAQLAVALSHEDAERRESLAAVQRVRQLRMRHDLPIEGEQP